MNKFTIDVTESVTRRYVVLADSYDEAIELGMTPLVELQDVSGMSAYERIRNFKVDSIVVKQEEQEDVK